MVEMSFVGGEEEEERMVFDCTWSFPTIDGFVWIDAKCRYDSFDSYEDEEKVRTVGICALIYFPL